MTATQPESPKREVKKINSQQTQELLAIIYNAATVPVTDKEIYDGTISCCQQAGFDINTIPDSKKLSASITDMFKLGLIVCAEAGHVDPKTRKTCRVGLIENAITYSTVVDDAADLKIQVFAQMLGVCLQTWIVDRLLKRGIKIGDNVMDPEADLGITSKAMIADALSVLKYLQKDKEKSRVLKHVLTELTSNIRIEE